MNGGTIGEEDVEAVEFILTALSKIRLLSSLLDTDLTINNKQNWSKLMSFNNFLWVRSKMVSET